MMSDTMELLSKPNAVGVIPTDTVYGIVACASDHDAVARLYALKSRQNKPGTLLAANIEQLEVLGLKRRYLKAVEQYWPEQISIVIPCADPALSYLHQGKMSLAVRIPSDNNLHKLLKSTGALLSTSANPPNQPVATTVDQAKKYFRDKVDFYIDGGDLSDNLPSTIIRIVDDAVEVLREGAVKFDDDTDDTMVQ